jgi:hypothetical protein
MEQLSQKQLRGEHERVSAVVPLVDEAEGRRIYDPAMLRAAVLGGLVGGIIVGFVGFALAVGWIAVAGLGPWAAAGSGPTTFAAASIGIAVGALGGGLFVLYRLPRRQPSEDEET